MYATWIPHAMSESEDPKFEGEMLIDHFMIIVPEIVFVFFAGVRANLVLEVGALCTQLVD